MTSAPRRAFFSSLALSSLVAVTVAFSGLPASAVDYQPGCYPLLSKACEVKEKEEVAPTPNPNPSPTVKPTAPADDDALRLLAKNLKSEDKTKPIKVSDDATIGGKSTTVAERATVDTSKKSATVAASCNKPVSVAASGFNSYIAPTTSRNRASAFNQNTFVEVVVWVTGREGLIDLGNFTPDANGVVNTPPVTLSCGSRATFVFREMVPRSAYAVATTDSPTRFNFRSTLYKFADYGAKYPQTVLLLRSSVSIQAAAS
jgi:hypothetical protein